MNNVTLTGRLTRDPETRWTTEGMAITTFTLAVDRTKKKDGSKEADFIRIVSFGRQAELAGQYLAKGRKCAVLGRIQTGKYENKHGEMVYTTDVAANQIEFLDGPAERQATQGQGPGGQIMQHAGLEVIPTDFEKADDDIPF